MQFPARNVAARLLLAACLVNLFVYGLTAAALAQSRTRYLDDAESNRKNLAHSLASSVAAMLDRTDIGLSAVVFQVEQSLSRGRIDDASLNSYLAAQKKAIRDFDSVWVVDKNGNARWGSTVPEGLALNVADRDYFQKARDDKGGSMVASRPQIGRVTNTWSVIFAKRIAAPDGSFAGIAAASLPMVPYFNKLFSPIDLGRTGIVSLRGGDMVLFGRHDGSNLPSEIGSAKVSEHTLKALAENPAGGSYRTVAPVDGIVRMANYKRGDPYPFYVFASQGLDESLASWRAEAWLAVVLLACFTATTALYSRSSYKRARQTFASQEAEGKAAALERERLQKILDSSSVGIVFAAEHRLEFINPKIVEVFGSQVGGKLRNLYVEPEAREAFDAELKSGKTVVREMRMYDKRGDIRHMLITYVPTTFGEISGILAWLIDITDRKKDEETIRRAKDAALAATRAKSDFLANMSHEIRTPLNAIIGLTHLMRRDGVPPGQAARLQQIERSGEHLVTLVSDILDLSKVEAGRLVLDESAFALSALLGEVDSMIRPQALEKGLDLRLELPAANLVLRGDAMRLRQSLLNYLSNAVKFTASGRVTLRCHVLEETLDAAALRFEVEDSGIGMASDQLAKLFTPFEQLDASTSRRFGGTGLGLAITKQFAQLMGGSVDAASVQGRGSTFSLTVKLPKADHAAIAAEAASESTAASVREGFAGARILLAEDNAISAEVVLDFLRETGLAVDHASDGAQALELARSNDYDLVLMDMQMPGMDGLEATRRIRALPQWGDRPIIALTANVFAEDRQRCAEAGMNDFLSKPMRPPHLYGMLLKWLARHPRSSASPVPAAPDGREPALAADSLDELARIKGMNRERVLDFSNQPAKYMRMLDMLVIAHAPELSRLSECLVDGDLQRGSSVAHSLRGAAAMLGAESVQGAAAKVEDALRAGDTAGAELAMSGLRLSFDELSQAVRAMREAPLQE